jgi:hypothetical protein
MHQVAINVTITDSTLRTLRPSRHKTRPAG